MEPIPAIEIRGLDAEEQELVRDFLEAINDQDDGFADFRETATSTISPLDRIKDIVLPDFDRVADDYEPFLRNRQLADDLEERIGRTDAVIDKIVYELYGLDEDERELVEDAVGA